MKSALKRIIFNCKHATMLIEKRNEGNITAAEALQLQVHLAGCSMCRRYQAQSLMINKLVLGFQTHQLSLDETYKLSLQQRINQALNKM